MIGFKVKKKRFSLLYLEENEFYVQDLTGSCTIYNFTTNTEKLDKCKIHICSKSVIIEPSDWETPIQKLLFKYMKSEPKKYADIIKQKYNDTSAQKLFDGKTGEDRIILHMKRIVEIPTSGPPSPYIVRDNLDQQVAIIPAFESLDRTMTKLVKLFEMVNQTKDSVDLEQKIKSLVFEDRSNKFDISHLESISERPLLKNQIIARRILPLISITAYSTAPMPIYTSKVYTQSVASQSKGLKSVQ